MKYFKDNKNPTVNELVYWFQVEFTGLANEMKKSNHSAADSEPNPYHIEDQIWAHTMMVCQRAEIDDVPKITKISALLHDIGKPLAREEIPFEAKKPAFSESNEIRNEGKHSVLKRKVPKSGVKCHFRGHEGLSAHLSIEPLRNLLNLGVINEKEMENTLRIISMHGSLFDNISEDDEMKKPNKVFEKFQKDEVELFEAFISQVKCDSLGRFFVSKDGRKNNAYRLGSEIFTKEQFLEFHNGEKENFQNIKNTDRPYIEVLIGVPGSGKSTYLANKVYTPENAPVVISRDNELMKYADNNNIEGTYSEIWKKLTDEDQKNVDKELEKTFNNTFKQKRNMVVDMTNMSNKAQRKWTNKVNAPKLYSSIATIFATSYDEVYRRLEKREKETGKAIHNFVIKNMMKGFMVPNYSNFEKITYIF